MPSFPSIPFWSHFTSIEHLLNDFRNVRNVQESMQRINREKMLYFIEQQGDSLSKRGAIHSLCCSTAHNKWEFSLQINAIKSMQSNNCCNIWNSEKPSWVSSIGIKGILIRWRCMYVNHILNWQFVFYFHSISLRNRQILSWNAKFCFEVFSL